jgi:hypothetical protein
MQTWGTRLWMFCVIRSDTSELPRRHGQHVFGFRLSVLDRPNTHEHDTVPIGLEVRGAGLIDSFLYSQTGRLILHLVNLTNEGTWRGPIDELIAVGPLQVRVKLPDDVHGRNAQFLVSPAKPVVTVRDGWASFEVKSILDHEVVVIG